jgi:hypothetical protein
MCVEAFLALQSCKTALLVFVDMLSSLLVMQSCCRHLVDPGDKTLLDFARLSILHQQICTYIQLFMWSALSVMGAPNILFINIFRVPSSISNIVVIIWHVRWVCVYICVCMYVCMYVYLYTSIYMPFRGPAYLAESAAPHSAKGQRQWAPLPFSKCLAALRYRFASGHTLYLLCCRGQTMGYPRTHVARAIFLLYINTLNPPIPHPTPPNPTCTNPHPHPPRPAPSMRSWRCGIGGVGGIGGIRITYIHIYIYICIHFEFVSRVVILRKPAKCYESVSLIWHVLRSDGNRLALGSKSWDLFLQDSEMGNGKWQLIETTNSCESIFEHVLGKVFGRACGFKPRAAPTTAQ